MKFNTNLLKTAKLLMFAIVASMLVVACGKDEEPMGDDPIASFQFSIDGTNFLQVTFSNFSQNATTYSWDFGDGNTSTEQSPTHTYAAEGDYTVTLTASNSFGSDSKSETVSLTDPNTAAAFLAGTSSKTWYLDREGIALGIGPTVGDNQWWSFGGVTPLGDRPCILDDTYTFDRDGNFIFNSNNTIFVDSRGNGGWFEEGVPEGCHDEDEAGVFDASTGEDVSAFGNGGDYTYEYDPSNGTLAITGLGAYIGLPNKTANGDNYIPESFKEYTIFGSVDGDLVDSLHIALVGDGFSWNFYLVSYENASDVPEIPGPKPSAAFSVATDGLTISLTNNSKNSTSYSWDFGDGGMSSDFEPVYTYADAGEYTISLTAMDDMGNMDVTTQNVTVSLATFSADKVSSAEGKVWKLDPADPYKVGPFAGSGEWFNWGFLDDAAKATRACQLEDEWIFFDDGTMMYDPKGMVYAEGYMGGTDMCVDPATLPAPYNLYVASSHMFSVDDGADPATITAMGEGAFIGFNKGYNGGELNGADASLPTTIMYQVVDYAETADTQVLTIAVDIAGDGGAWWTMKLTSPK